MASNLTYPTAVKVVGANGQISIGKQFAGRQILVEELEPGVWLLRTASVIPDNERWLHDFKASSELKKALNWSLKTSAQETNLDQAFESLSRDGK